MRDTLVARIVERMSDDDRILFLTGDLGFGVLDNLSAKYPDRLINAGASEQNMASMAAGLALEGYRPFIYSIANFPTIRALEQLRNDICYHRLPVRIVSLGGGLGYGPLGPSHHASDDLGALLAIPGLDVYTPSTGSQVVAITDWSIDAEGPVYIRIDRGAPPEVADLGRLGAGRCGRVRDGKDATVFTYGTIVAEVMAAANALVGRGVEIAVDTLTTLRPLDSERLLEAASTGPVLTVEEHGRVGGLATTFCQTCVEAGVAPRGYAALTLGDDFVREVGSTEWLRQQRGLDCDSIMSAVLRLVSANTAAGT